MGAREIIAEAALLTAVVSRSESERIADAVLAAFEAAEIVLARYGVRYLVPLETIDRLSERKK